MSDNPNSAATIRRKPYRWVSCSQEVDPVTAKHRHLVREGGITTVCGSTASMPDVWRGNSTKPACPRCEASDNGRDAPA